MPEYKHLPETLSTNKNYIHLENEFVPWAPLKKPLKNSKVALVTMGGFYLPGQLPFTDEDNRGDPTFRELPRTVRTGDCGIAHTHYEHRWVEEDINCLFPLDIFTALEEEGVIAELSDRHFSFMGSIPNPLPLVVDTAPEVARRMREDKVDFSVLAST